jgi:RNA polymerase sigma-70 factor (ECF subfamily)
MSGAVGHEMSDDELLRRAKAGEREAFGALYSRYQHIVYRFARAMTGSPDVAEDVTQEVFVVLMRNLGQYDARRGALGTYLYGVTRNVSRHRLRRERRFLSMEAPHLRQGYGGQAHLRQGYGGQAGTVGDEAQVDDPSRELASAQTIATMRRALVMLPTRYREVIVLSDLHELPGPVVAEIIGITPTAVRSRLHRGRQMLKQRIQRLESSTMRPAAHPMRCSV